MFSVLVHSRSTAVMKFWSEAEIIRYPAWLHCGINAFKKLTVVDNTLENRMKNIFPILNLLLS